MMTVDVLFPLALPLNLSYRIPEEAGASVVVGSFVRAPVGKRTFLGVVVAIHPGSSNGSNDSNSSNSATDKSAKSSAYKFITSVEAHLIPVAPKRIELWRWISEYYLCTPGEVMKASILSKPPKQPTPEANPKVAIASGALPSFQGQILSEGVTLLRGACEKTELYINMLHHVLLSGKNVLLLTPEIGSGEQRYLRLKELIPHPIFLLHSRQTPAQRQKTIQIVAQQRESTFVIGMRSALLLLDMQHFGLIVIEDEHDFSYKQIDPAPRFHARDLAVFIGRHYRIPVILSSPCPSLESEYNVRTEKYRTLSLDEPTMGKPIIEIIDTLRLRKKKQMSGSFSHLLLDALEQGMALGKQALFFTHRCAQLQEELLALRPAIHTARLDESHSSSALQQTISQFKNREIDVLLGTHTVYSAIDWGNIGLVALFDADKQLSRSDFRAYERAYQTLMTLLGNLGSSLSGTPPRIIVQTEQPDQPFYRHLELGDSENFVLEQLRERKEYHYPPFTRLVALRFKHRSSEIAHTTAQQFAAELAQTGLTHISGPFSSSYASNTKLHTQLIWLHLPRQADVPALKKNLCQKIGAYPFPKGIIQIDVDPY